jgi:isopenicillin N synthase-like dioxygenase
MQNQGEPDRVPVGATNVREALKQLPIIDMSPFLAGGELEDRKRVAAEIRAACINVGFFYLSGHGFTKQEFDDCEAHAHRFFNLPLDIKMRYRAVAAGDTGFVRIGGVDPSVKKDNAPDLKERFVMVRNLTTESLSKTKTSHWPTDDVLPGFTKFMQAHLQKRTELSHALARAFAMSLFVKEDYFDSYFKEMALVSLINFYPVLDQAALANNQWSFSPHVDYGGFTLLSQDSIGGLQVRNAAGDWIDVPPIDGTFVVNIGDLMARWTNDIYTSNLHRAANVSGVSRVSIPFFASPHPDALIECIETCRSQQRPARYGGIACGEYLRQLITQSDSTGRPGISQKTSERLQS